jgi:TonB family protein
VLASDANGNPEDSLRFSFASDIVELVIFTTDDVFMQTLREAVGDARRLWQVRSADKVSDLLLAGQVGILVLDVKSHTEAAGAFVAQIKRQFPDLVVVVAGNRDAETALAKLISDGIVYRFIHKPMSPARAKLFADAAVKKYQERRNQARASPSTTLVSAGKRRRLLIGAAHGVVGAGLVAALVAAWALRHGSAMTATAPTATVAANSLPIDGDSSARAGPAEVRERLLAQAEHALLEERLEEAGVAIEAARKGGVESGRVTFLTSQLATLRERLKGPVHLKNDSHSAQAGAGDDRLQQLLSLAAERITDGRLIDPDQDSARFYVLEALQIDPNGNATQAAKKTLARDLLAQARGAIDRRDFARAASLLDAADGIAAASNVEIARLLLRAARQQVAADSWDQLLQTAQERLQQDRLIEPAKDSAKYYLMTLRDANPSNAGLAPALQDLGLRLVAKARRALALQQYDVARNWLDEAAGVGFSSTDSSAALRELQAATERQDFLDHAIDASRLTLVKSVKPTYPTMAEQTKTEGWVELDFTVAETGEVEDIAVHAANPPGVFDNAAIGAVSHWRYQPVLHDDKPAAQRARIRIRFTLAG